MDASVYRQITYSSLGHPRRALTILEQVLGLPKDEQEAVAKRIAEEQAEVLDLCRALIEKASWKKVRTILSGLTEEPESIRRAVMGYATAVLMKEENDTAAIVLETFSETPFYDAGKPQLVYACYSVTNG